MECLFVTEWLVVVSALTRGKHWKDLENKFHKLEPADRIFRESHNNKITNFWTKKLYCIKFF